MEYQIIVDPVSGSKNSIFSKKGIEIINNYISQYGGGKCLRLNKSPCIKDSSCNWVVGDGCKSVSPVSVDDIKKSKTLEMNKRAEEKINRKKQKVKTKPKTSPKTKKASTKFSIKYNFNLEFEVKVKELKKTGTHQWDSVSDSTLSNKIIEWYKQRIKDLVQFLKIKKFNFNIKNSDPRNRRFLRLDIIGETDSNKYIASLDNYLSNPDDNEENILNYNNKQYAISGSGPLPVTYNYFITYIYDDSERSIDRWVNDLSSPPNILTGELKDMDLTHEHNVLRTWGDNSVNRFKQKYINSEREMMENYEDLKNIVEGKWDSSWNFKLREKEGVFWIGEDENPDKYNSRHLSDMQDTAKSTIYLLEGLLMEMKGVNKRLELYYDTNWKSDSSTAAAAAKTKAEKSKYQIYSLDTDINDFEDAVETAKKIKEETLKYIDTITKKHGK